jgi:hypothetical protein
MNIGKLIFSTSSFRYKLLPGLFILLAVCLLPFLMLGEHLCLPIFDDLDDCFVKYKVLSATGSLFSSSGSLVGPLMNGLPRSSFPSEFNVVTLLFAVFPPLFAYVFNNLLIHVGAYFSMAYFLRRRFRKSSEQEWILILISLGFALLPFYPYAGFSVAGLPLLTNAFRNLYRNTFGKSDWLVIALFPFCSSLFYEGAFSILLLSGFAVIFLRRTNRYFLAGVGVFVLTSVLSEYRVVAQLLMAGEPLHRIEFKPWLLMNYYSGWDHLTAIGRLLFLGHPNDLYSSHPFPVHTVVFLITALILLVRKDYPGLKTMGYFAALLLLICSLSVLNFSSLLIPMRESYPGLNTFQFDRIYNLLPPVYYFLFFWCCFRLFENTNWASRILTAAAVVQLLVLLNFSYSFKELVKKELHTGTPGLSYADYYSPSLFHAVRQCIGLPVENYRVLSIGLNPAIPLFNGFYTLDGHISAYPMHYKRQFRLLIQGELEKNSWNKKFYDYYGSRCYAFSSELEALRDYRKEDKIVIRNLQLNTTQYAVYKKLFIFSSVEIENTEENKLMLIRKFEDPASPWRVYLYKVMDDKEERVRNFALN